MTTAVNTFAAGVNGLPILIGSGGLSGDGWDAVDIGGLSTLTYSNSQLYSGIMAARFDARAGHKTNLMWTTTIGDTDHQVRINVPLYFTAWPTVTGNEALHILRIANGSSPKLTATINGNGTVSILGANGDTLRTSEHTIPLGHWFQMYLDCTFGVAARLSLFLDSPVSPNPTEVLSVLGNDVGTKADRYIIGKSVANSAAAVFRVNDGIVSSNYTDQLARIDAGAGTVDQKRLAKLLFKGREHMIYCHELVGQPFTVGDLMITVDSMPTCEPDGRCVFTDITATRNGTPLVLDLPFVYVNAPLATYQGGVAVQDVAQAIRQLIASTVDRF